MRLPRRSPDATKQFPVTSSSEAPLFENAQLNQSPSNSMLPPYPPYISDVPHLPRERATNTSLGCGPQWWRTLRLH